MLSFGRLREATVVAVLGCVAFSAGLYVLRDETFALRAFDDLGILLFSTIAALACARAARAASGRDAVTMWVWCAKATVFSIGQVVWTWLQLSGRQDLPFPSLADVFYLAEIPLLLVAVFMVAGSIDNTWERLTALVEGGVAAGSVLFITWVLFLGDAFRLERPASTLAQVVSLMYPLGTGAAAATLLVVATRHGRQFASRLPLLTSYAVWMTGVNVVYAWSTATGRYATGGALDVAWPIGFSLLTLAALAPGHSGYPPLPTMRAAFARAATPFLFTFAAVAVAGFHAARQGDFTPFDVWAGLSVIALMLIQRVLGIFENLKLHRTLEDRVQRRTGELRESRERYRTLVDGIGEVIFQLDSAGRLTFLNKAWIAVTGYRVREVLRTPLALYVHPDDRDGLLAAIEGDGDAGSERSHVARLIAKDDTIRWLEVRVRPLVDADGVVSGYAGTIVDTTVRYEAEDAVRESEGRWRLLLESSGEGIYGTDRDGTCTFINAAASALLGYPEGALLGRNMHAAVHHSRRDGSPYDSAECPARATVDFGVASRVDDEWLWRSDGTVFPVELSAHPLRKDGEITGSVVTFADITARRAAQDEIRHRSLHDGLTGLPNRTLLIDELETTVRACDGDDDCYSALLIMDLDRFKDINDTFGHPVGDVVLQEVAARMTGPGLLRSGDTVGRLGGDEFAVVLADLRSPEEAAAVAEKIVEAVSRPIYADGHEFKVGCSIGIAIAPVHGTDPTTLLQRADVAMYVAKGAPYSVATSTAAADDARIARLELIGELRAGIDAEQLVLHYQPIVDIRSGELARLEALVRWNHPTRGLVWPDSFVPVAEQAGVIMALTTWALRDALRQSRLWCSEGIYVPVAVNISAQTLHDPRLQAAVEEWFAGPAAAGPLEIEITESALLSDPDAAIAVLTRLVSLGVRVAIDDFGTGYSSLVQLKRLPVHAVKVDKSFVAEMLTDRRDASIVQTVIDLSHTLGLEVVAEGVETALALEHLLALGCDYAQGWHFGESMAAADITPVLLAADASNDRFGML